jgi:hypothetical protein
MQKRLLWLALLIGLLPTAGQAQIQLPPELFGTYFVRSEPTTMQGSLVGCLLHYSALTRDFVYRQGRPVTVKGSIGVQRVQNGIGGTLKVVLADMVFGTPGAQEIPTPPAHAYLRSKSGVTNIASFVAQTPSDTPGGLFVIYKIDDAFSCSRRPLPAVVQ